MTPRSLFGAHLLDDGHTRFSLWAPAAQRVELVLAEQLMPMQALADGFHGLEVACPAGTRYRFRIDGDVDVPDPASRLQDGDVHGASVVVDQQAYHWRHAEWRGRPWREMVIMEVHVGCFGDFEGLAAQLPRLAAIGITAIEVMPVADFPGARNWGYDGVLPFAPDTAYGTPEQLKCLIDTAHGLGLCIYLDVVYNHFGPEGNHLSRYAPQFFQADVHSPWGAAIDFSRRQVRDFFTANALYWLQDYRFDGLRLDAVHAIDRPDWLDEMAATVRSAIEPGRHVHLILENERNVAGHLHKGFDAQWNDDAHNALHVLLTGERNGYYANFADRPVHHLARCLTEGFAYQGEVPPTSDRPRGQPSAALPPASFVLFLQNHDQIGNRAMGERLITLVDEAALRAAIVLQCLCPQIPLLFMGEEFGCQQPFLYFTDFHEPLASAVREGRRREFSAFPAFAAAEQRALIPDPNAVDTFARSCPSFGRAEHPEQARWVMLYKELLQIRRQRLLPWLEQCRSQGAEVLSPQALRVRWRLGAVIWEIACNLGRQACRCKPAVGELVFASTPGAWNELRAGWLSAQSTTVFISVTDDAGA